MSDHHKEYKKNDSFGNEENYNRIPEDFLKDIYIVPNNFINPENEDHGNFVN
jgi:hypothetical protein